MPIDTENTHDDTTDSTDSWSKHFEQPLRNFSAVQIQNAVAKALTELTGRECEVQISNIDFECGRDLVKHTEMHVSVTKSRRQVRDMFGLDRKA